MEGLEGAETCLRMKAGRLLHPPFRNSLPSWGPANPGGEQTYQYWPFSTSDLYNWKTQTPSFSKKPQGLIDLLDSILFTHNPTWDDCQQLLQVLFTREERERILSEARKHVPGVDGRPTTQPHLIEEGFSLM